jgi:hypothetical protein
MSLVKVGLGIGAGFLVLSSISASPQNENVAGADLSDSVAGGSNGLDIPMISNVLDDFNEPRKYEDPTSPYLDSTKKASNEVEPNFSLASGGVAYIPASSSTKSISSGGSSKSSSGSSFIKSITSSGSTKKEANSTPSNANYSKVSGGVGYSPAPKVETKKEKNYTPARSSISFFGGLF